MTVCPLTDLPASQCGCRTHHRPEPTVVTISQLEHLAGHRLPAYRMRARDPRWKVPDPTPTMCDHRQDDLCPDCDRVLDGLLYDLPELIEHLTIALRKGHRFAPHGHRRGDVEHPDEAPILWSPAAASALGDLHRIMADRPGRKSMLYRLSRAAARTHRIVDRPQDREITMCPRCRSEIVVTNRDLAVTCTSDTVCGYAASWDQHQRDLLEANEDAMLTMNDLVLVLTRAGEPMTRDRINKMIKRHGLPRERIENPAWREGRLVTEPQWVYRLGDVRHLQAEIDARKAS